MKSENTADTVQMDKKYSMTRRRDKIGPPGNDGKHCQEKHTIVERLSDSDFQIQFNFSAWHNKFTERTSTETKHSHVCTQVPGLDECSQTVCVAKVTLEH